ncbi:MAG TPA: helix-turn-helix transcriptional regulator [Anseongella sp.]
MGDTSSSIIRENIRHLRQEKRYSQEYMAICLTVSQNAYSKLERGLTRLTFERLSAIANILGTSAEELMRNAGAE